MKLLHWNKIMKSNIAFWSLNVTVSLTSVNGPGLMHVYVRRAHFTTRTHFKSNELSSCEIFCINEFPRQYIWIFRINCAYKRGLEMKFAILTQSRSKAHYMLWKPNHYLIIACQPKRVGVVKEGKPMFHRSRVHPIWPSYMCNYSKNEMGAIVDNCRQVWTFQQ